jgi:hypothetical protein
LRLADWPRNPYLNDELREWVRLHLESLGAEDVAIYALAASGQDDERRVLVATEVGLLDSWYAPHGSTARFSLSVRLYPWTTVRGVDLRGETFRLWAHEHQSRWRLRLARPALDTMADTPDLGRALAEFAATCSAMAEPNPSAAPAHPRVEDAVPAFLGRAAAAEARQAPQGQSPSTTPPPAPVSRPAPVSPPDVPPAPEGTGVSLPPDRRPAPVGARSEETVRDMERRLGLRQPEL